ncbi:ATP-binding protein [Dyella sp. 333MFSha]|uniref:ATP-binding protein n=1 Tax=Dyella sp. 333MFSha TaxID=1798240 RepID=UPI000881CF11|nr:ATP-binding protein [Dyella sp. 333MFSha]SDF26714.1 DNA replication protein DnaC [Dyella sp. 333MFSha]
MTEVNLRMDELLASLRSLRLPGMALALEQWVSEPKNAGRCSLECVAALISGQQNVSAAVRTERFRRKAVLPDGLVIDSWQPSEMRGLPPARLRHLETLAWLDRCQNLVITGPTRSGKTHLVCGLARRAVNQGRSVHFARVPELLTTLEQQSAANRERTFRQLGRYDLVILDDFALEPATAEATFLLWQVVDRRERWQRATIVASPRAVDEWDDRFADPTIASGIFGRLLMGAHEITLRPWSPKKAGLKSS